MYGFLTNEGKIIKIKLSKKAKKFLKGKYNFEKDTIKEVCEKDIIRIREMLGYIDHKLNSVLITKKKVMLIYSFLEDIESLFIKENEVGSEYFDATL